MNQSDILSSEFDSRNGPGAIEHNHWLLFPNGAKRQVPSGFLCGPPSDRFERAKNIVEYLELKSERAVEIFDEFKAKILHIPDAWAEEEELLSRLKTLQANVKNCQKSLKAARKEMKISDPNYVPPAEVARRQRILDETEDSRFKFQMAVKAIEV